MADVVDSGIVSHDDVVDSGIVELYHLSDYHDWREHSLDYHLNIVCIVYYFLCVPKWLLLKYF